MTKVLLVKLTSLGDCIHALPALTDAKRARPDITFDWAIDQGLAQIAQWHPAVDQTPTVALRRWRKSGRNVLSEIAASIKGLRKRHYDLIIDSHAMFKSRLVTTLAKGPVAGYCGDTVIERGAHIGYRHQYSIEKHQHAVERIRHLYAKALGYDHPGTAPDYGIAEAFTATKQDTSTILVMANTTWPNKHWGEDQWRTLFASMKDLGYHIKLTSGSDNEWTRINRLAQGFDYVEPLPRQSLQALGDLLLGVDVAIAVDTGLGHLAAALSVPCLGIYGPTDPILARNYGDKQTTLSADFHCAPCMKRRCKHLPADADQERPPCMETITPAMVLSSLKNMLAL